MFCGHTTIAIWVSGKARSTMTALTAMQRKWIQNSQDAHFWNTDPTMYHSENLRNRTEKRQHEHYPTGTKPTFEASGPIQNLRQNPNQSPT